MNKTTTVIHPQTVEIPRPLEIHPDVDPILARELLAIADAFAKRPESYVGHRPFKVDNCGCIVAHLKHGNGEKQHDVYERYPKSRSALKAIWGEACIHNDATWAIARIEQLLTTNT